jgi:hypothetical protein
MAIMVRISSGERVVSDDVLEFTFGVIAELLIGCFELIWNFPFKLLCLGYNPTYRLSM